MTSAAQVEANRSNAQKSTGPRTAEGKAVSGAECRPAWPAGQGGRRQRGRSRRVRVLPGADAGGTGPGGTDGVDAGPADRRACPGGCAGPNGCRRRRLTRSRTRASRRSRPCRRRWRPRCSPSWPSRTGTRRPRRLRLRRSAARRCRTSIRSGCSIGCWCTSGGSSIVCTGRWPSCGNCGRKGELPSSIGAGSQTRDIAFGVPVPPMNENRSTGKPALSPANGTPMLRSRTAVLRTEAGTNRAKRTQLARKSQVRSRKLQAYFQLQTWHLKLRRSRRKAVLRTNRAKRTQLPLARLSGRDPGERRTGAIWLQAQSCQTNPIQEPGSGGEEHSRGAAAAPHVPKYRQGNDL